MDGGHETWEEEYALMPHLAPHLYDLDRQRGYIKNEAKITLRHAEHVEWTDSLWTEGDDLMHLYNVTAVENANRREAIAAIRRSRGESARSQVQPTPAPRRPSSTSRLPLRRMGYRTGRGPFSCAG